MFSHKIDQCKTASEVANSQNIPIAISWVAQAWKEVKEDTVCKCFRSAGFLGSAMDVVSCEMDEEDPFADNDDSADLQVLITEILLKAERCNVEEYVNGDELLTCNDMEDEKWEETFMSQLGQQEENKETEDEVETESIQLEEPNTITTFKDAIKAMEDIQDVLESRGHVSTSVTYIGPAIDAVATLQVTSMRQRTLDDYYA